MKYIKSGHEVDVDVSSTLPDNFQWKLFSALIEDLGFDAADVMEIKQAVRLRNPHKLSAALSDWNPRSMISGFGSSSEQSAFEFFRRYQLYAFLKKYPFRGIDTRTPAFTSFREYEKTCRLFNSENWRAITSLDQKHPIYSGIISEIQKDIKDVLGVAPSEDRIAYCAQHGPGVSLGDQYGKGKVTSYFKYSTLPYTVTQGTLPYARFAISSDPRWIGALDNWYRNKNFIPVHFPINIKHFWDSVFEIVDGNRITSVPKSYDTDRTIAVEPLFNVFLQLGVDRIMRKCLLKWGYDLNDQSLNQVYAFIGSLYSTHGTLDLKGASDTIALRCCSMLLPPDWFGLLWDLRSPTGTLEGKQLVYQKISSMGNGFTFALESTIFAAIVRAAMRRTGCCHRGSAVYGDDLVVPNESFDLTIDLLNLFGFKVNVEKSFKSGAFRESCGADYFQGIPVRPFFLKKEIRTIPDLFYVYNSFLENSQKMWQLGFTYDRVLALLLKYIPAVIKNQFFGPRSESLDTHLFENRKLPRNKWGQRCYYNIVAVPKIQRKGSDFFFRKLMVSLKPKPEIPKPLNKWSKTLETGNAFDITRRDRVQFICTRCDIP